MPPANRLLLMAGECMRTDGWSVMTTRTNATSQVYWAFAHRFWKCSSCNNQWDSVLLSSRDGLNFTFDDFFKTLFGAQSQRRVRFWRTFVRLRKNFLATPSTSEGGDDSQD